MSAVFDQSWMKSSGWAVLSAREAGRDSITNIKNRVIDAVLATVFMLTPLMGMRLGTLAG
jgi:hypothetical protein